MCVRNFHADVIVEQTSALVLLRTANLGIEKKADKRDATSTSSDLCPLPLLSWLRLAQTCQCVLFVISETKLGNPKRPKSGALLDKLWSEQDTEETCVQSKTNVCSSFWAQQGDNELLSRINWSLFGCWCSGSQDLLFVIFLGCRKVVTEWIHTRKWKRMACNVFSFLCRLISYSD